MDESDQLMTLKKAYADIILNTSKEAAARLMVAERKAMKFQQELVSAREDGIHMLLRLKQMMDCKITEAEMKSLSQQSKINELEAQLNEAEDIVGDLRAELRQVQDALAKAKLNKSNLKEQKLNDYTATQKEQYDNTLHNSTKSQSEPIIPCSAKDPTVNQRNEGNEIHSGNESQMVNEFVGKTGFDSIVMMNKEPELSRKGCTQRIRAFDRNLLDVSWPVNSEKIVREDEKREDSDIRSVWNPDKWISLLKDSNKLNNENHAERKRKRENDVLPKDLDDQDIGTLPEVKWVLKDSVHKSEMRFQSRCVNDISNVEKGSPIEVSDMDVCNILEKEPDELKQMKPACKVEVENLNGLELLCSYSDNEAMEICEASKNSSQLVINNAYSKEETPPIDENEVSKDQESGLSLIDPLSEMDIKPACLEENNENRLSGEVELNKHENGVLGVPANDRLIKYTFRRKTKKEPLSSNDESSSYVNHRGSLDSEKSTMTNKSSRSSERLAEVARQKLEKVASDIQT